MVIRSTLGCALAILFLGLTLHEIQCTQVIYKAAVVEHVPVYSTEKVNRTEALAIIYKNLDIYQQHLESVSSDVNIILFPEDGLYGVFFFTKDDILPYLEYLPDLSVPVDNASPIYPCDFNTLQAQRSPVLNRVACMAREYNITIVLNMGEVRYCDPSTDQHCPSDKRYQYNTLIAVSSSGQFVAKYHKSHLYYEPQFDQPVVPDVVYFDSDFGVRFGMMICFDLMFEEPQLSLYYQHGVTDFLWSSWWVNEPPLITATQVNLARSLSLPSNFLASGIGLSWAQSGSGIYSYGTPLRSWYNPTIHPVERLLIASITTNSTTNVHVNRNNNNNNNNSNNNDENVNNENINNVDSKMIMDRINNKLHGLSLSDLQNRLVTETHNPVITTFTIVPGMSEIFSSSDGNFTCYANVTISKDSPAGEVFGVYSLSGIYNDLFPASICALQKCITGDPTCTQLALSTSTIFEYFSIESSVDPADLFVMYPMVATNHTEIMLPRHYYTNVEQTRISSIDSNLVLMNAALFGLAYHL